ncbi:MAG: alpha/beta hydrolase [Planctomycetota bacterium]
MRILALVLVGCLAFARMAAAQDAELKYDLQEKIVYHTVEDRELLLDAFVPKNGAKHPAVLVVHGGAWRSGNRYQLRGYATALAEMGFVCFAIDYRLAPKHKFPAQIDDCRAAVKWIRQNGDKYKADVSKLGAIGYSAGGHLVSLLATTGEPPTEENGNVDTRIQCCVAGGAPTDFRWFPDQGKWAKYWMGGDLKTVPERFQQASSAAFVDANDAPVFFFNGTKDELVPLTWSQSCHNALKAAGVRTEFFTIQDASHMRAAADPEALKKAYEFLQSELMSESTPASESEEDSTKQDKADPKSGDDLQQ